MAIALAVACSKGITDSPAPTPTPPDPVPPVTSTDSIVTVSFTTGGEVVLSEEPLTKSIAASPDDLWGFQVYQYQDSVKNYFSGSGVVYASGYYDCLDSIKMPLVKGKWYGFTLTYIPNGKNIIAIDYAGRYASPFNSNIEYKELNKMYYNTGISQLKSGIASLAGGSVYNIDSKYFTSVERYQGVKWNVLASDSTTTIAINLYRMMTGVKIEAEDFTSGTICVKGGNSSGYNPKKCQEYNIVPAMDTIVTTRDSIMPDNTVVTLNDTVIQVAKESILDITVQTPSMPTICEYSNLSLAWGVKYSSFCRKDNGRAAFL